jgi:site-specific DNA-methyltransferase (adenine-specific)
VTVGDALECLRNIPDNCVDITITSPPYNKKVKTQGWLVKTNGYSHFNDQMPEEEYQTWQIQVLNELFRVTKPGGSLFYNHKLRWFHGAMIHPFSWVAQSKWAIRQEIIWDRILAANVRGWRFWQVDERIYWLYKPIDGKLVGQELESRHAKMSSIWRLTPTPRMEHHPAPFPIELPVRAIYSLSNTEGMIILDPFSGTGTTLVAAKLLGHSYIGFDISPTYVDFARERLNNSASEVEQVKKEKAKHLVSDPFINRKRRGTVTWPYGPKKGKDLLSLAVDEPEVDGSES